MPRIDYEHNDTRLELHRALFSIANHTPRPERMAYLPEAAGPGPAPGAPGSSLPACQHGRGLACTICYPTRF